MRREHEVEFEQAGLSGNSRRYIVRCGAFKKRKEEHAVVFFDRHVIFHGHGSTMAPAALIQEMRMKHGDSEGLFGCAYLAHLLLHLRGSDFLVRKRYRKVRTKEMMEAEAAGIPEAVFPELMRVGDRRRDHSRFSSTGKDGQFGKMPLGPNPGYFRHRALWAITQRHQRDREKMERVLARLERDGVRLDPNYTPTIY